MSSSRAKVAGGPSSWRPPSLLEQLSPTLPWSTTQRSSAVGTAFTMTGPLKDWPIHYSRSSRVGGRAIQCNRASSLVMSEPVGLGRVCMDQVELEPVGWLGRVTRAGPGRSDEWRHPGDRPADRDGAVVRARTNIAATVARHLGVHGVNDGREAVVPGTLDELLTIATSEVVQLEPDGRGCTVQYLLMETAGRGAQREDGACCAGRQPAPALSPAVRVRPREADGAEQERHGHLTTEDRACKGPRGGSPVVMPKRGSN